MSLHHSTRRLAALTLNARQPLRIPSTARPKSNWAGLLNPFSKRSKTEAESTDLDDPAARQRLVGQTSKPKLSSSIFEDEVTSTTTSESDELAPKPSAEQQIIRPAHLAPTQDPDPRSRVRWERKAVMQMVRRGGRESRAEIIRRTEREMRYRSPFLPTSVKKLMHVARQVADKNVDDALVQMQYSKKKISREVAHFLRLAVDRAVVEHGMGLGKTNGEAPLEKPRKIKDSEGRWMEVSDPTRIYIAQAWVGRGPWRGQRIVYRGRGRKAMHKKPSTSISFVLKEERTRVREYDEAVRKEQKQGPWVHLPNRPISAQRPYYTW